MTGFLTFVVCHDSMLCYQVNWVKLCLRYLFYVTNESINNGVSGFENREVQIMHEEQKRIKKKNMVWNAHHYWCKRFIIWFYYALYFIF